jgi:hypothetical protein
LSADSEGAPLPAACPECGAQQMTGEACRDCFEALLAFENERPPVFGAVHHLTVACYFLQHPAGYALAALTSWRELLASSLDGRETPRQISERMRRRFDGAERVRDPSALPPAWWPRAWPMTVHHVLRPGEPPPTADDYIDRARRWAAETRASLDHAEASGPRSGGGIAKPTPSGAR